MSLPQPKAGCDVCGSRGPNRVRRFQETILWLCDPCERKADALYCKRCKSLARLGCFACPGKVDFCQACLGRSAPVCEACVLACALSEL